MLWNSMREWIYCTNVIRQYSDREFEVTRFGLNRMLTWLSAIYSCSISILVCYILEDFSGIHFQKYWYKPYINQLWIARDGLKRRNCITFKYALIPISYQFACCSNKLHFYFSWDMKLWEFIMYIYTSLIIKCFSSWSCFCN